ncbi:beta-N-acetylhexosaminidase [Anaerosporobacter sp.]|uniref:beta-N-acetylhexosaminidase n=1 Tax=Anaerosporobacter sp. TaxID=1872529 RepID=UPI00289D5AC0|nr:family 20 glycosylhydrolase [Anaerosporobacter sp.]
MLRLIPKAHDITIGKKGDVFTIGYQCPIVYAEELSNDYMYSMKLLQTHIKNCLGYTVPIRKGKKETGQIYIEVSQDLSEEEYNLIIKENVLNIVGGGYAGVLYGIQTLRQMIDNYGAVLPVVIIKDYPDMKHRGFYHDVTRGRIPTLDSLKALADKLAFYKINQLQLYIEHSFLFRDFSEVWRDDTPLTPEEIMELDVYCKKLNIDLVPSIASFGHLYKVLCTKTYAHLCELPNSSEAPFGFFDRQHHHTLDVSNPESMKFVIRMLEEYMPLFSSKYFNLCGDETFDLGKGRSKALADQVGERQIYIDFVHKICEYLIKKGKTPMFWGDVISAFPSAIKELPEETICLNWGYEPNQEDTNAKRLREAGAKQILCPGVIGWNQLVNASADAYENIKRMCTYAYQYDAIGVLNTDWGDYGHVNHPEFSMVGMIYGAAFSWNKVIPSFESINEDISWIEYRDQTKEFVSIVEQLSKQTKFPWFHIVGYKERKEDKIGDYGSEKLIEDMNEYDILEANKKLTQLIAQLYAILSCMDSAKRPLVKAYVIAAEGISLWNEISLAIKDRDTSSDLSVRLEYWYHNYKELWRESCKESELYRIGEVIFWYADLLRSF